MYTIRSYAYERVTHRVMDAQPTEKAPCCYSSWTCGVCECFEDDSQCGDFNPKLSLFIPYISSRVSASYIANRMNELNIGFVRFVDLVKPNKPSMNQKCVVKEKKPLQAAIYFHTWYENKTSRELQRTLNENGYARISHGEADDRKVDKSSSSKNKWKVYINLHPTKFLRHSYLRKVQLVETKEKEMQKVLTKIQEMKEELHKFSEEHGLCINDDGEIEETLEDLNANLASAELSTKTCESLFEGLEMASTNVFPILQEIEVEQNVEPDYMENQNQCNSVQQWPERIMWQHPMMMASHCMPYYVHISRRFACYGCYLFSVGLGGYNQESHACLGF